MLTLAGQALAPSPNALVPQSAVAEASRALQAGRPEQARDMIARAVAGGASGQAVDRLLADLALAERRWPEALARYKALLAMGPGPLLQERAGLAALHAGQTREAFSHLTAASRARSAGWRSWNALGVAADRLRDWPGAERAYSAALKADPGQAAIWNNLGWSLMLRGRWADAVDPLTRAAALGPTEPRILANLDLARSAVEGQLPRRRAGESGAAFAARLNDAGVMARLGGDLGRAAAAFAQALEVSDRWFAPAAENLAAMGETGEAPNATTGAPPAER